MSTLTKSSASLKTNKGSYEPKERSVKAAKSQKLSPRLDQSTLNQASPIIARKVRLEFIETAEKQQRKHFDEDSIIELSKNIKLHGMINPITVIELEDETRLRYQIVAGERRYRAAKRLDLDVVPVHIVSKDKAQLIQLSENLQRENLSILEEAEALRELQKELGNVSQEQLSRFVNKSSSYVGRYLLIAKAPSDVKELLAEKPDLFSKIISLKIATEADDKKRQELIRQALGKARKTARAKKSGRPVKALQRKNLKDGFNVSLKYRDSWNVKQKERFVSELKQLIKELEQTLKK